LAPPQEIGRHYQDLVLSERGLREGRWWTLFTHTFLHEDFNHLASNLQSFLLNGSSAFLDWGIPGLYGIFFVSAGASALNRWGRERQACAQLEGSIPRAPERLGPVAVPEVAREWWDGVRRGAAKGVSPTMHSKTEAYGASGGVCGLMGYGLVTTVIWLSRQSTRQTSGLADQVEMINAASSLLSLLQTGYFLVREWQDARGDRGITGIDHAGHLTGFATGAALGIATAVLRWTRRRGGPREWQSWDDFPRSDGEGRRAMYGGRRRYISATGEIVD